MTTRKQRSLHKHIFLGCMATVVVVVALTPFYINLQLLQTATTLDGTISSLPPPTATGNHIDIVTPSFDDKSKDIADFINAANQPIPIYTEQLAIEAIRPSSWHCSPESEPSYSTNHTVFAFIHVYKTAGTTLRKFFHEYAYTCHKTWISLATCTNVEALSIISGERWKPCQIEEVANGRKQKKEQYNHPKLKNCILVWQRIKRSITSSWRMISTFTVGMLGLALVIQCFHLLWSKEYGILFSYEIQKNGL